jgi:CHAD domain-containing protein
MMPPVDHFKTSPNDRGWETVRMRKKNTNTWLLSETISPEQLIEEIAKDFSAQVELPQKTTVTYFDSFDWRLYRKHYLFIKTDNSWQLIRRNSGEPVATFSDKSRFKRKFAGSFSPGPLKALLESTLDIRGLIDLVTFETISQRIRIFNADEKTVAYINVITHQVSARHRTLFTVSLTAVRGYKNVARQLRQYLRRCGISKPSPPEYLFWEGVSAMGRFPGDYSSKFSIALKSTDSIRQAALTIYRQLLDTMKRNEAGIKADIDSEFLHDFRVAIRRTRSGLTQLKGVLPPKVTENTRAGFAELGRITGPTRDLDVYLLYEKDYLSRLPGELREGMAGFFTEMSDRRHRNWKQLVKALQSPGYREIIGDWQAYLDGDSDKPSKHSEQPAYEYSRKIIYRRYDRIMKKGGAISASSPDEALHRLRIQCKKLRYSLEFFSSLYPPKAIARVIKQLKGLQNNLGSFNDLSVQQDMLQRYLATIKPGSKKNLRLGVSIGGLLTALHHEQKEVRKKFVTTFEGFSGAKNSQLFSKLFG